MAGIGSGVSERREAVPASASRPHPRPPTPPPPPTRPQYDLSVGTFSPDGRVFQTDYAQKAVDSGG